MQCSNCGENQAMYCSSCMHSKDKEIERLREIVIELAGMAHCGHNEDVGYHLNSIGYEQCLYCRESRDMDFADAFYKKEDMTLVEDESLGCGFVCSQCMEECSDGRDL